MTSPLHENTRELENLLTAAARAEAKFDWEAAAELYTQVLDMRAKVAPCNLVAECDIYERRAECHNMVGDFAAHLADLEKLADLAQEMGDVPRWVGALTRQARLFLQTGEPDKAYQVGESALDLARQAGDRQLEVVSLAALGHVYRTTGNYTDAREVLDKGHQIARDVNSLAVEADILMELAYLGQRTGRVDEGRKNALAALDIYRRLGDRKEEGEALIVNGTLASDLAEKLRYKEQALAIFEAIGNRPKQRRVWNNLGFNYIITGLYHRAEEYLTQAVESNRYHGHKRMLAYSLDNLALAYLAQGDLSSARAAEEEAMALTRETGDHFLEGVCHIGLCQILLAEGCTTEAVAVMQTGVDILIDINSSAAAEGLAWLGAAHLAQGETDKAVAATQRAIKTLNAHGGSCGDTCVGDIWWWRYKTLAAHAATGGKLLTEEVWGVLDHARSTMLARVDTLNDAGLRRSFFNKIDINRQIIHEWVVQALRRSQSLSPLMDHISGEGDLQGSFGRMIDIGVRLNTRRKADGLPRFIIDEVVELTGAERMALVLYNAGSEKSEVFAFGFPDIELAQVEDGNFPTEMTALVEESLHRRAPLLRYCQAEECGVMTKDADVENWGYDPGKAQYSVLCAPLTAGGKLTGLVYCELDGIYGFFTQQDLNLLAALANQAALAIENTRWAHTLEQRVEARTAELLTIHTISQAAAELELDSLIGLIGEQVREVFAADIAYIALYNAETKMISFPYGYGDTQEPMPPMPLGMGMASHIIKTGKPLLFSEKVDQLASELEIVRVGKATQSYLGVPILCGGETIGVISVQSTRQRNRFSQADADLLSTIAANMGAAIYNARLFEDARKRAVEAETLRAAGLEITKTLSQEAILKNILDLLRQVVDFDSGSVQVIKNGQNEIVAVAGRPSYNKLVGTTFPLDNPMEQRFLVEQQPIIVDDMNTPPDGFSRPINVEAYTWMGVPVIYQDRVLGKITCNRSETEPFTERDANLTSALAGQLAAALENARLFEEARRSAEESDTLRLATAALSSGLAEDNLFEIILEQLEKVISFDSVSVLVLRSDHVEIIGGRGFSNPDAVIGLRLPFNNPVIKKILKTRTVNISPDVKAEFETFREPPHDVIKSLMSVPIIYQDRVLGILTCDSWELDHFTEHDAHLASAFANQAAVALENARLFEETRQARQAADAANQAKSAFLANMSHELRTPLNAILGFSNLIANKPNLTPGQKEDLGIILQSGEHLLELINDVLEMSKIESGRMTLNASNFDLYFLLDELQKVFQARTAEKGLTLLCETSPDLPRYIYSDKKKLRQVFFNLLSNAVKFTELGSITLRSRLLETDHPDKIHLSFEVEDTGPGIPADQINDLFDYFVQTDAGRKSLEGTGLGLSICKNFVHMMGGTIRVTSEPGKGSIFIFDIVAKPSNKDDVVERVRERRVIGLETGERSWRILIVEDQEANRKLLIKILEPFLTTNDRTGFEIREAVNGKEAVEIWEEWKPDLILMDIRMPEMDGRQAAQKIRASLNGLATKIIALTASAFEGERQMILSEGVDDFIRKPYKEHEILNAISKHLEGIRFIYAEGEVPKASLPAAETPQITLQNVKISDLPLDWLAELKTAAAAADSEQIFELLKELSPYNSDLANAIENLVRQYRFDRIVEYLEV